MTGRDFLTDRYDEKLREDDLDEEELEFTQVYYQGESTDSFSNYPDDYGELSGSDVENIYAIENSRENYDKLKPVIDRRYAEWKKKIIWP